MTTSEAAARARDGGPYLLRTRTTGGRYRIDPHDASRNHAGIVHGGAWCFISADITDNEVQQVTGEPFRPDSLSIVFVGPAAGQVEAEVRVRCDRGHAVAVVDGRSGGRPTFHAVLSGPTGADGDPDDTPTAFAAPAPERPSSGVPFRDFIGVTVERVGTDRVRSMWRPDHAGWRFLAAPARAVALCSLFVDCSGSILNDVHAVGSAQFVTASLTVSVFPRLGRTALHAAETESKLIKRGRRTAFSSTSVTDVQGNVIASGTTTYLLTDVGHPPSAPVAG